MTRATAPPRTDVVVVGAGLAGLTTARAVVRAGRTVTVLEARDRVGGRVRAQRLDDGTEIDVGGQWIGRTHDRMRSLADEMGVDRFASYRAGSAVLIHEGRRLVFDGSFPPFVGEDPPVRPDELADAKRAFADLDDAAATVVVEAPWETPGAATLDGITLDAWLEGHVRTEFARSVVGEFARIGGAGEFEPDEVSLLHMLFTLRASPQRDDPDGRVCPELHRAEAHRRPKRAPRSRTTSSRRSRPTIGGEPNT